MVSVPNFQPSKSGFHFPNSFGPVPDIRIHASVFGDVGIGNASNGLCGGMAFAVRDYFESKVIVPPDTVPPSHGDLFDYIVMRLFDSFNLDNPPTGLLRYMELMNPTLSDDSRASIMITQEWPKIKWDIDNGRLSPLALIEVKSLNAGDLGQNHQVLAYGYDLSGTKLVIHLYDPNQPGNDNVTLSLDIGTPSHATPVSVSGVKTVYCFFQPTYRFVDVSHGLAGAQNWKRHLSDAVNIGAFLITGGFSWLFDTLSDIFFPKLPVLGWNNLDGETLPGNYHITTTFDNTASPGTVQFALTTDRRSYKKQVAFQLWDAASGKFQNFAFANNYNHSPGASPFETSTVPLVPLPFVASGCFEFDAEDQFHFVPGRFVLKGLSQKLTSGTKVTFVWKDIN
jgi:hypothetical protein